LKTKSFAGANPCSSNNVCPNPPALCDVPCPSNFDTCILILSFATESGGTGNFAETDSWHNNGDKTITADAIRSAKSTCNKKFQVALGGANNPWGPTVDQNTWVNNAAASLGTLIDTYGLDGIDVDFENNLDSNFAPFMCALASNLKSSRNGFFFTLAPFSATWSAYGAVFQACPDQIDWVNYQVYAETTPSSSSADVEAIYANLAGTVPFNKLILGIDSNTVDPRGQQPPAIFNTWKDLLASGIRGAMVFSAEDSNANGFAIENGLGSA
jgi:hypothetical protein